MLYEFEDEAGLRVEVDYPMGEAPKIGETVVVDGKRLTRLLSIPQARFPTEPGSTIQLPPRGSTMWQNLNLPEPPAWKPDGSPAFQNRKEALEWAKKTETPNGAFTFDP